MSTRDDAQYRLFASPLQGFVANLSWQPGEGWRLWVSTWEQGETPSRARSRLYEHLQADEAVDVLCAEQMARCEWLAG